VELMQVVAGDARIWRTWNFAALGRGDTPAAVMESLIKELPRIEEHDWSWMLKEPLRQALIDQAQTAKQEWPYGDRQSPEL
jgi:hypothetical protein